MLNHCTVDLQCPYKEIGQISSRVVRVADIRVSAYAFVRDWVRVRVGIRLEG